MERKTKVVNVKVKFLRELGYDSLQDWLSDPNHVYIGRDMTHYVKGAQGSPFANPFPLNKCKSREDCLQRYRQHILGRKDLLQQVGGLRGKVLGCWCAPEGCHGDVLAELAERK